MMFRDLRADEIDVRVQQAKEKGFILLLYKDARVDMTLLDEAIGPLEWKREHKLVGTNLHCIVSIWNDKIKEWVSKEDVGTESMTEKTKGEASDSFKRACFNWGIGRELYTSPFIYISDTSYIKQVNGKYAVYEKFRVSEIVVTDKTITGIAIVDSKGKQVFRFGDLKKGVENQSAPVPKQFNKEAAIKAITDCIGDGDDRLQQQLEFYKLESLSEGTENQLKHIYKFVKNK